MKINLKGKSLASWFFAFPLSPSSSSPFSFLLLLPLFSIPFTSSLPYSLLLLSSSTLSLFSPLYFRFSLLSIFYLLKTDGYGYCVKWECERVKWVNVCKRVGERDDVCVCVPREWAGETECLSEIGINEYVVLTLSPSILL